jgi:succinate-semialdehyde dehydrogenase/glutarate-semialdehyde dehydrogenase
MTDQSHPISQLADPALLKNAAYINGAWVTGEGTFNVHDPATGKTIASVANLTQQAAGIAIDAANKAWPFAKHLSGQCELVERYTE